MPRHVFQQDFKDSAGSDENSQLSGSSGGDFWTNDEEEEPMREEDVEAVIEDSIHQLRADVDDALFQLRKFMLAKLNTWLTEYQAVSASKKDAKGGFVVPNIVVHSTSEVVSHKFWDSPSEEEEAKTSRRRISMDAYDFDEEQDQPWGYQKDDKAAELSVEDQEDQQEALMSWLQEDQPEPEEAATDRSHRSISNVPVPSRPWSKCSGDVGTSPPCSGNPPKKIPAVSAVVDGEALLSELPLFSLPTADGSKQIDSGRRSDYKPRPPPISTAGANGVHLVQDEPDNANAWVSQKSLHDPDDPEGHQEKFSLDPSSPVKKLPSVPKLAGLTDGKESQSNSPRPSLLSPSGSRTSFFNEDSDDGEFPNPWSFSPEDKEGRAINGWARLGAKQLRLMTFKRAASKLGSPRNVLIRSQDLYPCWSGDHSDVEGDPSDFWAAMVRLKSRRNQENEWLNMQQYLRGHFSTSYSAKFIIVPGSRRHSVHSVLSCIFILHDLLLFPAQLVFGLTSSHLPWLDVMSLANVFFWTMDIPCQFFFGFFSGGIMELRPYYTALHYARTWFMADLMVISVEWARVYFEYVSVVVEDDGEIISAMRDFVQLKVVVFVFRLVRLLKLKNALNEFLDSCGSEALAIFIRIGVNIFWMLVVSHYISCLWCGLGLREVIQTWMIVFGESIESRLAHDMYIYALHWTLTQFTPATNNISPQNVSERLFAIGVVLFALVTFSTFIGTLTGQIAALKNLNARRDKEEGLLRNYFRGKVLSIQLQKHIWQCFHEYWKRKETIVTEQDMHFFAHIPENVLLMLHGELYRRTLLHHPMFHIGAQIEQDMPDMVCHKAAGLSLIKKGGEVFTRGADATCMYIVESGSFSYHSPMYLSVCHTEAKTVVAEFAMWVKWTHKGSLTSDCDSRILAINIEKLLKTIPLMGSPVVRVFRDYASKLVAAYSSLSWPATDVAFDGDEQTNLREVATAVWREHKKRETQWSGDSDDPLMEVAAQMF